MSIYLFPEEVILNEPIENWYLCDCLICFYSAEFPLDKAIAYTNLRNPYVLNDLQRQFDLMDRLLLFCKLIVMATCTSNRGSMSFAVICDLGVESIRHWPSLASPIRDMSSMIQMIKVAPLYYCFVIFCLVKNNVCNLGSTLIEHNDSIEVNGETFHKPFVEKPVSADDHNICIYYQSSVGGGSQRLFRKVCNCINNRAI